MTKHYESINAQNITAVADMLLWGAKHFQPKDTEIAGISMRDLRWEIASNLYVNLFLEECINKGLHSVNCFGHLAEHHGFPIRVPEEMQLPDGLSNEVWDDLSFIFEVDAQYWETCVKFYNKNRQEQRELANKRGGYIGDKIKGE